MGGETDIIDVEIVVPNQTRYLSLIGNIAEQVAKTLDVYTGDRDALAYHLNLVLTEAMVNAIQHAAAGDADKTVRVCMRIRDKDLRICVYDHGQGFDLNAVPPPNLDALNERGRGIFFMRTFMDWVNYRKADNGNVLEMYKRLA